MDKNFDIAIIGNGAIGCAVALELLERDKSVRIAMIGKSRRPYSASIAAGAMISEFGEVTEFCLNSHVGRLKQQHLSSAKKLWPQWLDTLGKLSGNRCNQADLKYGTYLILNSAGGSLDTANYRAILAYMDAQGGNYHEVDPDRIPGLSPWPPKRPLKAAFLPEEAYLDTSLLFAAYDEALQNSGSLAVFDKNAVALGATIGELTITLDDDTSMQAGNVVVACGCRTQQLLESLPNLSRRIPRIFPGGGSSLVLNSFQVMGGTVTELPQHAIRTPNRSFGCGLHALPRNDLLYVGGTNYLLFTPWDKPNISDQLFLANCITEQISQDLVWSAIEHSHIGNRPVSLDGYPLTGSTSIKGLYVITGTFRDGLSLSPYLARCLANEILDLNKSFSEEFLPERAFIQTNNADQWIQQVCTHIDSAAWEHAAIGPTKTGFHSGIARSFNHSVTTILAMLDDCPLLPIEFFPLISHNPEVGIGYFLEYFKKWEGGTRQY